jgi:hypothetical protein
VHCVETLHEDCIRAALVIAQQTNQQLANGIQQAAQAFSSAGLQQMHCTTSYTGQYVNTYSLGRHGKGKSAESSFYFFHHL